MVRTIEPPSAEAHSVSETDPSIGFATVTLDSHPLERDVEEVGMVLDVVGEHRSDSLTWRWAATRRVSHVTAVPC